MKTLESTLFIGRPRPTRVDLNLVKSWLHQCEERHSEKCGPVVRVPIKLFRLVDVENLFLRDFSDSAPGSFRYVALSYVRGVNSQITVLKRENMGEIFDESDFLCGAWILCMESAVDKEESFSFSAFIGILEVCNGFIYAHELDLDRDPRATTAKIICG